MISFEEFKKVDLRIAKILEAERVEGSEKLIKFIFDIGGEQRQIIGGLGLAYPDPSVLVGKLMPIILNLEPRKLMSLESQGMIMAADNEGSPVILIPEKEIPPGSIVK